MDRISIIIPVYNAERWLGRCLDSVVAAADAATDIVVVDDGSDDMSARIAAGYAERYPHVSLITQEHGGAGQACRRGVEASTRAEWIFFVDSDDTVPADAIQSLRRVMTEDADMILGNINIHSEGSSRYLDEGPVRHLSAEQYTTEILEGRMSAVLYGKLIRRDLFRALRGCPQTFMKNHEDELTIIHLAAGMTRGAIIVSSIVAYNHICRPASNSSVLTCKFEDIEHLWNSVRALGFPRESLVRWGLALFDREIIDRGLEFPGDYAPARDLRRMARGVRLDRKQRHTLVLLHSRWLRLCEMRRRSRLGGPTSFTPHIAFIIVVHNELRGLRRTIESIFHTGFRNIEIILVDDASSADRAIEINALHVKFRRIHLIKNRTRLGPSSSRAMATRQAGASCVMYLNPGDTICRRGVYKAIVCIDNGADMAVCGRRKVSPFYRGPVFDPQAEHAAGDTLADRILGHILDNYYYESPLGGFVIRRSILSDDDFPSTGDYTTAHLDELLTRISLHLRPLEYAVVSDLGYNRHVSPRDYMTPAGRWDMDVSLAVQVLRLLRDVDAPELYPRVMTGLRKSFVRTASRLAANPFRSDANLRAHIIRGIAHPGLAELYEITGTTQGATQPEGETRSFVDTLMAEAKALWRRYPLQYYRFFILRH